MGKKQRTDPLKKDASLVVKKSKNAFEQQKKKTTMKQVLGSPYPVRWAPVSDQDKLDILSLLRNEFKEDEQMEERDEKLSKEENKKPQKKWKKKDGVFVGVNEVTKGIEKGLLRLVILEEMNLIEGDCPQRRQSSHFGFSFSNFMSSKWFRVSFADIRRSAVSSWRICSSKLGRGFGTSSCDSHWLCGNV